MKKIFEKSEKGILKRMLILPLIIVTVAYVILGFFTTDAMARDQIKIVGSSTVYPYSTVVAERFGKSGKFKTPVVEATGTGGGFKLFCGGVGSHRPDIINASRQIKTKEINLCKKNNVNEIVEITIGNDGIVLAHSVESESVNFTRKQLWLALAEQVEIDGVLVDNPYTKWSQIDSSLPDRDIAVLVPPATSGTTDSWNELVMEHGCGSDLLDKKQCHLMRTDGAVIIGGENDTLIVQKLKNDPNLFGFFGYSSFFLNKDKIQAAAIESVKPSVETIQDQSYVVARPLFFYVKKRHVDLVPGLKEFVQYFTSSRMMGKRGALIGIGLIPLSADKYKEAKNNAKNLVTINVN